MALKTLLTVTSVLGLIFGVAFLVAPAQVMSLYGLGLSAEAAFIPRYLGAAFISLGVINWLATDAVDEEVAAKAIVAGNLIGALAGVAVAVVNALQLRGNGLVWMNVGIYAALTLGFGYFQFVKRGVTSRRTPPGAAIPH